MWHQLCVAGLELRRGQQTRRLARRVCVLGAVLTDGVALREGGLGARGSVTPTATTTDPVCGIQARGSQLSGAQAQGILECSGLAKEDAGTGFRFFLSPVKE